MRFTTVPMAFAEMAGADPARPMITWYDDHSGERVELSVATMTNGVAKTANLVVDGVGLAAGDPACVDLPPHWQTAQVLLGCWSAGLRVVDPGQPAEVAFVIAERAADYLDHTPEVYGLSLAPLGAPMRDRPAGVADYVLEVRAHGDHFTPITPVSPTDPATDLSHEQLCQEAYRRAEARGLTPGARVLIDVDSHPDPVDWLLAPLMVGASTVLRRGLAADRLPARVEQERVALLWQG